MTFLISHLTDNLFHYARDVIAFIARTWNIVFSVPGMNKWLHHKRCILIITRKSTSFLDRAGYHRSQLVKDWAEVVNIRLHYLPPDNLNLNPIERMWKLMNEHARNNRYFSSTREFRDAISVFFNQTLPDIADSLTFRINDRFQVLKPAS